MSRRPFELAARVLSDSPIEVPPAVAPQLAAVIKRCLAKQPERRYRQAGEVRAALEAIQPGVGSMQPVPRAAAAGSLRRPSATVLAIAAAWFSH